MNLEDEFAMVSDGHVTVDAYAEVITRARLNDVAACTKPTLVPCLGRMLRSRG